MKHQRVHWSSRLPFYYGWLIIGIAFVTMAIGVTARTAFSLLLPPLIDEFGWDRGLTAGVFSFGFLVSAILSPSVGRLMDRHGPRMLIESGVGLMACGLFLARAIERPWQLYATLGVLVGGGANLMSFTAQSLFLPYWFVRRRSLAISIAFSGVGFGAILLLPWLQSIIGQDGGRSSCWAMGLLVILVLGPLKLPAPSANVCNGETEAQLLLLAGRSLSPTGAFDPELPVMMQKSGPSQTSPSWPKPSDALRVELSRL
jgi:MFS family permease